MDDDDGDRKPSVAEKHALDAAAAASGTFSSDGGETDDHLDERTLDRSNKKVKPALKKKTGSKKPKKALKWDEVAIEEHDLLRGTRMKIEEPNTPYCHYDSGQESDDSRRPKSPVDQKQCLSWDNLQNRLDVVAAVQSAFPSSPQSGGEASGSDVDEEKRKEMRNLEFKERRKRHYNEMELVRKFRQEHPDGLLDTGGDADVEDCDED